MPELDTDQSNSTPSNKNTPTEPYKQNTIHPSQRSPLNTHSPNTGSIDLAVNSPKTTTNSIDQLYNNICEIQSSDHSPSRFSYLSYGQDSRIDSELRYYAGGDHTKSDPIKKDENNKTNCSSSPKTSSPAKNRKPSPKGKTGHDKPPNGKKSGLKLNVKNGNEELSYLGPYLLKQARESLSSGDNPNKALEYAVRAMKSFENTQPEKLDLEFIMCLHIVAALYCILGKYNDAILILERSIDIPNMDESQKHSLAKFAGCMQLGDTYAMQGQIENSISCYMDGLEIQKHVLGDNDARFGETCRYVAEAHVQAMQFDEAKKLCRAAIDIHGKNGTSATLEEAADRRLMGLICDSKGDYETALEHYVLASMATSANGHESDAAAIDVCIGDVYLSLSRYDEAIFSYQKALNVFRLTKGENHPSVASVFVRLADLYNKIGKFRESETYCEHALRIYSKPISGNPNEEIADGLIEVSAIYESMNELDRALELLKKALKAYRKAPGQLTTVAGVEAQIGVLCYMTGSYWDSYDYLKVAVSKFRVVGEKKSVLLGVALNQMGLACVQIDAIDEAADLFEEARGVLEMEYGPHHPETLGVCSNLAGTYDALGRWDDAIEILEYAVVMREEKLGTANPDVDNEKRWLTELLKESCRDRSNKSRSLEFLLDG